MMNIGQICFLVMSCFIWQGTKAGYIPTYLADTVEYAPHVVHSIPAAVSHQSQTIVHESRPYLRPIVSHNTHYTPISSYEPYGYASWAYAQPTDWSPKYVGYGAWRK